MPDTETLRHNLPYLTVAQASKEITHNEALFRIDALLHPVVESQLALPPAPALNDAGRCWLVASGGSGDWQGMAGKLATWTGGSWRFQVPAEGMTVRNRQTSANMTWSGTDWISAPAIPDPQAGTVIDAEARSTIVALLSYLRSVGQIASE